MSCKNDQIQEEQMSLLQSSSQPQSKSFANVPFQPNQRSSVKTQEDKSIDHNQSCKSSAEMTAELSLQNPNTNHNLDIATTNSNDQTLDQRKAQSTQIQTIQKPEQKVQSNFQKEKRLMREQADMWMQQWLRQSQIDSDNEVKRIKQKVRLQLLQQQEERQRIIAMHTWSDEISFFQNIKRFLGITQRKGKKNK